MPEYEDILERLGPVPHRVRVAFAAAAAERALPIYRAMSTDVTHGPAEAIDAAWTFALEGALAEQAFAHALEGINAAFPDETDGGDSWHYSCAAVAYALDAVKDETTDSATLAASRVTEAMEQYGDLEDAIEEESEWQENALAIAESWQGDPTRAMFDEAGPARPEWFATFDF